MNTLDHLVVGLFFLLMVAIGLFAFKKNKNSSDYFVAGKGVSWWLTGISHHVSGYSGAVFVGYAAIAYTHGFTIYIWWALTVGLALILGSFLFPQKWYELREKFQIQSPLEFIESRYGVLTQQVMVWSGVFLKLFDMSAKWVAISILLNSFVGVDLWVGIVVSGGVSLLYVTFGGLWAVLLTDFSQFIVQVLAGFVMLFAVMAKMDGLETVITLWDKLPEHHSNFLHTPYNGSFVLVLFLINFLSYNGGTWNLATRFISSKDADSAVKASRLSGILYLIWPLILFFPMWAAPILLPNLEQPETSYALLTKELLPHGLIGLVLASMFANTMSMTSSDANTIAAVINRDILPKLSPKNFANMSEKKALTVAMISTFLFTLTTVILAMFADYFGGVLGLLISWFGGFVGIISIPMLFGLLKIFKPCRQFGAMTSMVLGMITFVICKVTLTSDWMQEVPLLYSVDVGAPAVVTLITYLSMTLFYRFKG
jgi:SSS family transporter